MKKTILLLLSAAFMSLAANAQKITDAQVPPPVISAFKAKFPDVTKAIWEIENGNEYEVEFKRNGKEVSANFDNSGKWLETETKIKVSDLPTEVQNALKKYFAGFEIEGASKVESAEFGNCFEVEIEKEEETLEVLIALDGKILSKTVTEKELKE